MPIPDDLPLYPFKESPSQTAGPYVHIGLTPNFSGITGVYDVDLGTVMINDQTKGERITLEVCVIDGGGTPLKDALVEIWQADADGLYNARNEPRGEADPNFTGWGRAAADAETGILRFETTRGDRFFISLLGSAFIHLAWLGLVGPGLWWALGISLVYAIGVFRTV